jgi:asparagine synthase (glutamine-hydrolysing)
MCGICGFIDRHDVELLERMTSVLIHRGPDDGGTYVVPMPGSQGLSLHLGNRRLSIIDLSAAGHQPMTNDDQSICLTFNGEIYGYREIRGRLISRGYRFRSQTDTEVVLRAYEEWGERCVEQLDGMFAFAVWDGRRRRLLLARDRLGKKPLYYAKLSGGGIIFASEIKSILCHPRIDRTLDRVALNQYLTFQYVPAPRTLFEGIAKLPAGNVLLWADGEVAAREYWDPSMHLGPNLSDKGGPAISFEAAKEELKQQLIDAVKKRLISDVPLGLLLSGGLDSSLIAALMSRECGGKVKTFTVGFEDSSFNEAGFARDVANHLGTDHHEMILVPKMTDVLSSIIWHLDEPVADQAALPTFLICQRARSDVKVLLTGEGGDEVFLGYPRYVLHKAASYYHGVPGFLRKVLPPWKPSFVYAPGRYLLRILASSEDVLARNLDWMSSFPLEDKELLYTSDLRKSFEDVKETDVWERCATRIPQSSQVRLLQYLDLKTWLADDILMKLDKMSMAASVEARAPYLDYQLLEWALRLPEEYLLKGMTTKRLLRSLAADYLPSNVVNRPKQAFRVPTKEWFERDLLKLAWDLLLDQKAVSRGYFRRSAIEGLLIRHRAGKEDASQRIWNLLVLEVWHQIFLDRPIHNVHIPLPLRLVSRATDWAAPSLLITTDFPPSVGGIQTYLSGIYHSFPGNRLTVIGPAHPGAECYDRDHPYRAIRVGDSVPSRIPFLSVTRFLLEALVQARRIVSREGCALIHCGHVLAGIVARQLKQRYGTHYLVWTHSLELTDRLLHRTITRVLRGADLVITNSDYTRRIVLELGVLPTKIATICPRVDPNRFRPGLDASAFRERHRLNSHPILLTTARLARLQRYKGVDMVLRSLPKILLEAPQVLYVVAGSGNDERYLVDLARTLGVQAHVRFVGNVSEEELPLLYAAADVFLMMSREERTRRGKLVEGFGIVFLEASASGKPVIGGNSGGIPDAVRDGLTGFLVDPCDPNAIAAATMRLLTEPGLAERLGRQGREWVEKEMNWEKGRQEFHTQLARFFPSRLQSFGLGISA